ncbi:MAG TPA: DUF6797 domain-containing protein [Planctomicrobium sp.]|nr:DUF6797 domain-containing protein [Planctomicrobium sp.]
MRLLSLFIAAGLAVVGLFVHFLIAQSAGIDPNPYDPELASRYVTKAAIEGDVQKGATLFSSARLACLQCHRVGNQGGTVGPDLTKIGTERGALHIIESILWPKREVKPEYVSWNIATVNGDILTGYKHRIEGDSFELLQPASGKSVKVLIDDVDDEVAIGTLMPDGLLAATTESEKLDLFRFVMELGRTEQANQAVATMVMPVHAHKPALFPLELPPQRPEDHLLWQEPVNENRMYDFYAKEANYFRTLDEVPALLVDYPELNGGALGKWGRKPDPNWRDFRWNESDHGSLISGVFYNGDQVIPRGICVRLGDNKQLAVCFNPTTLQYEALWKDGFVTLSGIRYGFMDGLTREGTLLPLPESTLPAGEKTYQGLYRSGNRVVFAYRIGEVDYLDSPWSTDDGQFVREVAPVQEHSQRHVLQGGPTQWPTKLTTKLEFGSQPGYAIDTIEVPFKNPYGALFFFGGVDFLSDGTAVLCSMMGDVWTVTGLDQKPGSDATVKWKRFAIGLHQPLGLIVVDDVPYVLGRDMITRLHDLNGDGEADYYECFSNAYTTSPAGHDFITGLERDSEGYFYTASGNQGLLRISPDGKQADVIATGLRNPDGLGILPDGRLTVPCSQGNWTPASMVCAAPGKLPPHGEVPHYGYLGPIDEKTPSLPLFYLPRGMDNSSGGQTFVSSDRWGPMQNHLIHYSYGAASAFLILEDEVNGQHQGTIVPLPGDFRSGIHRGRVNPQDGQLYIVGMNGWTCFAPDDGSFQRVRYTGTPTQVPVGIHAWQNGVSVEFALPLDPTVAGDLKKQFAQAWNYRYSRAYGSAEFSPSLRGVRGHDHVPIQSVHIQPDGKTLFLEIPSLQPVNQLHLQLEVNQEDRRHDLIATIHALDQPFTEFPGYQPVDKTIAPHPILADMNILNRQIPNPWIKEIKGARAIVLDTGKNLTFKDDVLKVKAGEAIKLTLRNPDVVPHNWALIRPGSLQRIGEATNGLIADPDAYLRHYVPESDDVLVYTDIVDPGQRTTVSFVAPDKPGRYPYLCTFPGHWTVMNGTMVVE